MVYTELAPRRQQFHVAPAMQQPKSAISTQLPWKFKNTRDKKGYSHSFGITCDMCAASLLDSCEQRYIKAMNHQHQHHHKLFYSFPNLIEVIIIYLFTMDPYCFITTFIADNFISSNFSSLSLTLSM